MRNIRWRAAAVAPVLTLALGGTPAVAATVRPLHCHAWVSNSHPADYSTVEVFVRTATFTGVRTRAHYRTTTTTHYARTGSARLAVIPYRISDATPGYRVRVSVRVVKHGRAGFCRAFFTPHA